MSFRALPILFINLGGEMLYILDQRLHAQNIPPDKARKVLHDIVNTMFSSRFMEELFKPQELYTKSSMRMLFDRLAHASIMRLNTVSMDKLYDLMTMAVKYQLSLCLKPSEILLITLNHIDTVSQFIDEGSPGRLALETTFRLLIQNYSKISNGQWQYIRQTLMNFFQDMHIRVSIFLKEKCQSANGRFVIPTGGMLPAGFETPGCITTFRNDQRLASQFNVGQKFVGISKQGSLDMRGDRVTKLGLNMYHVSKHVETLANIAQNKPVAVMAQSPSDIESNKPDPNAKAQLDLLTQLIAGSGGKAASGASKGGGFKLNLFKSDEEESQAAANPPSSGASAAADGGVQVLTFDARKGKHYGELTRIMGELSVTDEGEGEDDLLALMDSA